MLSMLLIRVNKLEKLAFHFDIDVLEINCCSSDDRAQFEPPILAKILEIILRSFKVTPTAKFVYNFVLTFISILSELFNVRP